MNGGRVGTEFEREETKLGLFKKTVINFAQHRYF